jgi:hypothetical protein
MIWSSSEKNKTRGGDMEIYIGSFKGQAKQHIIKSNGIDQKWTACEGIYRKDCFIMSYAGPFTDEEAKKLVTCERCLKTI